MHALCDSTPSATVFTLKLQFGKIKVVAMIDTSSDISFINAKFATKHKFQISATTPLQVAVANGSTMLSETTCSVCSYSIQDQEFSSDFRLLELQGYDIILGADWIFAHSPVGFNLRTRELTVTKNCVQHITSQDEYLPPHYLLISPMRFQIPR